MVAISEETMMVEIMLGASLLFAFTSGMIWFVFLRRVPIRQAMAVVRKIIHKPAGTYWQQQVGISRGFRTPIPIPIAECFVLELYSQELGVSGNYSIDPSSVQDYHVGQNVVMEYQRRGLPLIGYKTTVLAVRTT